MLIKLGWHINFTKSCFSPKTETKFIGFVIQTAVDGKSVWLKVPKDRISSVNRDIKRILSKGCSTARVLARIAGQIVSMTKAVTPAKLLLRNLYRCLKSRQSWQDILMLDSETVKDLNWWLDAFKSWNDTSFRPHGTVIEIATDASSEAWGSINLTNGQCAQGFWTIEQ